MKHVLCAHFPQLPIDRFRRRQPRLGHEPFVLVETIGARQIVMHAPLDELPDIHPGMSLAEAKGRHLGLAHFQVAPAEDLRALEAIGRWLMKFSPNVCIAPPASIFLDATGVERLFDGVYHFRNHVAKAIASLQLKAGVAVAPTPGSAWAIAAFGRRPQNPVVPDHLADALAPLPTQALRLETETVEQLVSLGVRTIGQLVRLDREDLAVRFGWGILQRIDQAMGTVPEPLVFLEHHAPIRASLEFEAAIESLEVIHLAVEQLIAQVVELLSSQGLGARELRLTFQSPYAPAQKKKIELTRPSRNAKALMNLLRCALDTIFLNDGVIAVELCAVLTQRLGDEQSQLIDGEQEQSAAEVDYLVERLRARLESGVDWVELVESHIPERAFRYCKEAGATAICPHHTRISEFRPLSLLPYPRAIKVIVTPSECLDGQPISFTDTLTGVGSSHQLNHVRGPERMTGEWWTGQHKTRDYFDVLDTAGNRYWLFRVPETRRWYLHGEFE